MAFENMETVDNMLRDAEAIDRATVKDVVKKPEPPPPLVSDSGPAALAQLERRSSGAENPIPTPWPGLDAILSGGFFAGLYILVAGTGFGKTQAVLQMALQAALSGVPALYVSLELSLFEVHCRLWGLLSKTFAWTDFFRGERDKGDEIKKALADEARSHEQTLAGLPIHVVEAPPAVWGAEQLQQGIAGMLQLYPSRPPFVVVDFLQLVGPYVDEETLRMIEPRLRVGLVAYSGRSLARATGATIVLVSSAARDKYGLMSGACGEAGLEANGLIKCPDVLVGLGKESGEIEYAADGIIVGVRFAGPVGKSTPIALTVPKLRAGRPGWTALYFNGHRFDQAPPAVASSIVASMAEKKVKEGKVRAEVDLVDTIPW